MPIGFCLICSLTLRTDHAVMWRCCVVSQRTACHLAAEVVRCCGTGSLIKLYTEFLDWNLFRVIWMQSLISYHPFQYYPPSMPRSHNWSLPVKFNDQDVLFFFSFLSCVLYSSPIRIFLVNYPKCRLLDEGSEGCGFMLSRVPEVQISSWYENASVFPRV
jgi:hypothetical protein